MDNTFKKIKASNEVRMIKFGVVIETVRRFF